MPNPERNQAPADASHIEGFGSVHTEGDRVVLRVTPQAAEPPCGTSPDCCTRVVLLDAAGTRNLLDGLLVAYARLASAALAEQVDATLEARRR